ncbi:MAG: hypothetical protein KF866_10680 [Phycisphaeraceae bacterium]|nr:hypothetical protein [Phycisphaeraceae bacterium]MCW5754355.1 hypothetical protein [Phycisphaeraceae bacterium]
MNTDTHTLLADFLTKKSYNLFDLAQKHGLTIVQLLDWFDSPETQAVIRKYEAAQAVRARLAIDVETAVTALADIAEQPIPTGAPNSVVETRRRAASQLIRLATSSPRAKPPTPATKTSVIHTDPAAAIPPGLRDDALHALFEVQSSEHDFEFVEPPHAVAPVIAHAA